MPAVELTITGVLYDKVNRTSQNVVLIGEAFLTGLSVGGGPIIPPASPGVPTHPIMLPGMPGWGDPHPAHPIVLPPDKPPVDPGLKPTHPIMLPGMPGWPDPPPTLPPPGSPPVMIPGSQPVQPITPPPAIIVDYPGVGKVLVPLPVPPAA